MACPIRCQCVFPFRWKCDQEDSPGHFPCDYCGIRICENCSYNRIMRASAGGHVRYAPAADGRGGRGFFCCTCEWRYRGMPDDFTPHSLAPGTRRPRRRNPKLTVSRGRVLANKKPIRDLDAKALKDNFVVIGPFGPVAELFGHDRTTHVMYCLQDEANRPAIVEAVKSQDFPMFQQHMSIRVAWAQGGSLGAFWKHKIAKKYLAGAVQFHHENWNTIEGPKKVLVLTHMAVKPRYRKNKLNTLMLDYIIKNRAVGDEAHDLVVFHEPTKDGWAFMKVYGGEEYMDAVRRLGAK